MASRKQGKSTTKKKTTRGATRKRKPPATKKPKLAALVSVTAARAATLQAMQARHAAELRTSSASDEERAAVRATAHDNRRKTEKAGQRYFALLAQGDSWFRYTLGWGVIGNVARRFSKAAAIVNWAESAALLQDMADPQRNAGFRDDFAAGLDGHTWDAVLLSGGGNDIVNDFKKWLNPYVAGQTDPASYVSPAYDGELDKMQGYFETIAQLVAASPGTLIFVHGYDFAIPFNVGVINPWLAPAFQFRGFPADTLPQGTLTVPCLATNVVRIVMQKFKSRLDTLAAKYPHIRVVPTQGTLSQNMTGSLGNRKAQDWANEMHPTNAGFVEMADAFYTAITKA
jgi:hypothetical protein